MRLPIAFTASSFVCLLAVALPGCAGRVALDPAGFGSPPTEASAESQVQAEIASKWGDRTPANIVVGQPKAAYHAKLSFASEEVIWQGYAVPVVMDIDTASGRRVEGRKYAAMFSGDHLVGLVDYPGTTNAKGSLGFYWSDDRQPVMAKKTGASGQSQVVVAKTAPKTIARNDLLIDPLRLNEEPAPEPYTARTAPRTGPKTAPPMASSGSSSVPVAAPISAPGQSVGVAPAPYVAPVAPKAPQWGEPPAALAVGTKLYLAANKSYIGSVVEYADLHAFGNGAVKPAVRVRYLNGAENWFTIKVAQQVYVVQKEN